MKIRILSDLHLEFSDRLPPYAWPSMDADVVVLAGDIDNGTRAIDWAERTFPGLPVIYVPGNHEFYDRELSSARENLRKRAANSPNLRLLDNSECVIDGVRFLGATLWTDFSVYGVPAVERAKMEAGRYVTDFRAIRYERDGLLTPARTVDLHREAVDFLERRLLDTVAARTVVVTHHAPHPGSIHPKWGRTLVNAAFVSDLTRLMGNAVLWIHGHTHDSFDYRVRGTRILANPMGYRFASGDSMTNPAREAAVTIENSAFDPSLIVTV